MVITPLMWACIIGFSSLFVTILRMVFIGIRGRGGKEIDSPKPLTISQYYDCVAKSPAQIFEEHEQFILELQEEKEKQEIYEIVLWWGLDGLKLKGDGATEWISRRRAKPGIQNETFQASRAMDEINNPTIDFRLDMRQIVQTQIDDLKIRQLERQLQVMRNALTQSRVGKSPLLTELELRREEQRRKTNRDFEQAIHMMDAYLENQKRNSTQMQNTQSQIDALRSSQMQNAVTAFDAAVVDNAYWQDGFIQSHGAMTPIYAPNSAIYSTNVVNVRPPPPRQCRINLKVVYTSEEEQG